VSVSNVDGSILFSKLAADAPRDEDGRNIGPIPRATETLVQSDPVRLEKVRQTRLEIKEEEEEARRRAKSGESGKRGVVAALKRLMPFGKGGWLRRRAREHAKAHLGEVILSVTNRGVLVSSLP